MSDRVVVIGSGLGALASACTLAARGRPVTLLEASSWLGGKAAVLEEGGFRFDMGPTILTVPRVLRRIFEEAGEAIEERLPMVRLDPQWRCFFEDGTRLDLFEEPERASLAIEDLARDGRSAAGYRRFLELSEKLHDISERRYFWRSVGGLGDLVRGSLEGARDLGRLALDVASIRPGATVGGTIRRHVPDPRVAQMLDHFTQYVGSAPDGSPAVLCGIAHMQTQDGIWYPKGGIRAVPEALAALAGRLGVELHTGAQVAAIEHARGRVTGVVTKDGRRFEAGAVVSGMDAVRTHRELLGGRFGDRFESRWNTEPACSGVVLYLGLNRRYEHLAHHDFVFSRDPHEEFEAIYERGEPAPDPTVYLCAPAATEPEVAPEGGEALYALVHTPYLRPGHDWKAMLPAYREVILDKLRRTAGLEDIDERIVVERALTPQDIHDRYRVLNGAIYGVSSHGRFTGAFKAPNRSPLLEGLYLAGGAAHPGPGMPMVLMSGWIAADSLDRDGLAVAA